MSIQANNGTAKDAESATAAAAAVDNRVYGDTDKALIDVATSAVDEEKPQVTVTDAAPPEATCQN